MSSEDRPSWRQDDEEEEEEEIDDTSYIQQKDAVLFAIEISPSMLKPPPASTSKKAEKDSPALAALKCAYQIMQQRIISSPKDMMGILLFGTAQTKFQDESGSRAGLSYPHCYLLSDLDIPVAEDVLALKDLVDGDEDSRGILKPTDEAVSMSNLLFCANQIFTTKAPSFGSRRLFIITDNDDPHSSDKNSRSQATVRAKDLYDLGCIIELFPISHPDHEFDRSKFYDDIIYRDSESEQDLGLVPATFKSSGEGISLLSNLISDVNSKQVAKRALFSGMPLEIGPGFKISVKGYNILQKQAPARACYIWDKGEELKLAVGTTTRVNELSDEIKDAKQIKKAYKFAGTQVLFTEDEQKQLKTWESPVIRIIGFKPQSLLPLWASVKKSTFIYPSEEGFVGSTRVFSALWQKLLADKKMGVAWHVARKNAAPVLVAILPSAERLDEVTKHQIFPAGLWLYQLPFADDLRNLPPSASPIQAPDILIDQMRDIVRQLQLPKGIYDPNKYPNRSLQWHYKLLQVAALQDETPDDMEDKSIPKYRQIKKYSGEFINTWQNTLDTEVRKWQKDSYGGIDGKPLKRGHEEDNEDKPKKKVKAETKDNRDLAQCTKEEIGKLIAKGALSKYTLADLRDFLLAKGEKTTGKKGDLVERIEQWAEADD